MWFVFAHTSASFAADIVVPDDAATFSAALGLANAGDRILLPAGEHTDSSLALYDPITIEGVGMGQTVITGGSQNTTLDIYDDITLRNLTVRASSGKRVAVVLAPGDLIAEFVTFEGGRNDTNDGGGLAVSEGRTATLTDCVFSDNATANASVDGSALAVAEGSTVTATRTTFVNNHADFGSSDGGAVLVQNPGSEATLIDCTFTDNSAAGDGGAIYATASTTVTVTDSRFELNDAGGRGGAIFSASSGTFDVSNTEFVQNSSDFGSAFYATGGTNTLSNVYVCENLQQNAGSAAIQGTSGAATSITNLLMVRGDRNGIDLASGSIRHVTAVDIPETALIASAGIEDTVTVTATDAIDNSSGGTIAGNLADAAAYGTAVPGPPLNVLGSAGLVYDLTDCDASFAAHATTEVVDLGQSGLLDVDGSVSDRGHLGGPDLDVAFWNADADGDGVLVHIDCDDDEPTAFPGGTEVACNGIDEDCDGADGAGSLVFYRDADGDSFGDALDTVTGCSAPAGYVSDDTDCDDGSASIFPGAPEVCDGVDQDCDGTLDEDPTDPATWFRDGDGDGFGNAADAVVDCDPGSGWTLDDTDCDDTDAAVSPNAVESCTTVGVDDDCNGLADDGDPGVVDQVSTFLDVDGDGFGTGISTRLCAIPSGSAGVDGDCDDADPAVNPGAIETCDPGDENCNGLSEEADPELDVDTLLEQFQDGDGDGYGAGPSIFACVVLSGFSLDPNDCDDADPTYSPGAAEVCDGTDRDCDGVDSFIVDVYPDMDNDGFGEEGSSSTPGCPGEDGLSATADDCDDDSADVNPDADEVWYNGIDENCDGNDGDQDEDGYAVDYDCDDEDPNRNPGLEEIPNNDVDEDCDGIAQQEDTDVPVDTDDTDDPMPTPDADIRGPCGCAAASSPLPAVGVLMLGLVGVRRRPQRQACSTR